MMKHLYLKSLKFYGTILSLLRLSLAIYICLIAGNAQASTADQEYQIKTALIYKLTKFITWPESVMSNISSFGVCLLGDDNFGTSLDALAQRETKGIPINIYRFQLSQGITEQCQVIFIEKSKSSFLSSILQQLENKPILTISAINNFATQKGILEFGKKNGRIEFIVNLDSLNNAQLTASAQLLDFATTITTKDGK